MEWIENITYLAELTRHESWRVKFADASLQLMSHIVFHKLSAHLKCQKMNSILNL
jgi:hypothetical protein